MKKKYNKLIITIIAMVLLLMPLQSFAEDVYLFDDQLCIIDDLGNGSGNETKYTAKAPYNLWGTTTNTIYMYNDGDSYALIEFGYSFSSCGSYTINGTTPNSSGEYSVVVESGGSVDIVISDGSWGAGTVTLTNVKYTLLEPSSNITYEFDESLGTVSVGGVNVDSNSPVTIEMPSAEIVATPINGAKFVAWLDAEGKIISQNATYTQYSTGDAAIKALFTTNTPYFLVDKTYVYGDLNEAVTKGNTIVLMCDAVLPAGDYVIPQGKTLLIPFDDANTLYTTTPGSVNESYAIPTVYRTLTMASGANITVNGAISVSAKQTASQGQSAPIGTYGHINMKDGSSITVNSGGNLYVWGYITGQGKVTAKSGAIVYESFQVRDWRGGNATTDMLNNTERVFPMSQYYVQNIEVPLTLEAGAVENGYMSVYVTLAGIQGSSIPFIGPSGMFRINEGSITKDYDEKTDRLVINVDGKLEMSSLEISMKISALGTQTVKSQNYTLPINGNITLHVNSGSEINISQDMALLPGGVINVYKGAKCILGSGAKVFIYDSDNWGAYCYPNSKYVPLQYAPGRLHTRTDSDFVDAQVYVEGEVDASNGYVYVTESGANIRGAEGGLVKLKADTSTTVAYQATQADTKVSFVTVPVTTAKIKNADGTYVDPETIECCSEYEYSDGEWISIFGHTFDGFNCSVCGAEKIATKTKYSISGENITINSSLILDVSDDTQIIIATYNSDKKLLNASYNTAASLEEITLPAKDVAMIKVFAWDGTNVMTPISIVEKIEL